MTSKEELVVTMYCRSIQRTLSQWNHFIPSILIELCIKLYGKSHIITIPVGQCGIAMNRLLLKSIHIQHNTGNPMTNTYCRSPYTYTPITPLTARSVVIDIDYSMKEHLSDPYIFTNYEPSNMIFGCNNGCGHNWAKGHYTEGAELIDECMDILHKEIEAYDEPQGIQLFYGLGGGTGSGMGTLLMLKIKDMYPDLDIMSFAVFHGRRNRGCVVRPYNTILSLYQMDDLCDGTFVIDNESLWEIVYNQFKVTQQGYEDINFIANQMVDDITSLFRFDDTYRFTMRSFLNEMVQFPKLKYFTTSRAPFYDKVNGEIEKYNKDDLVPRLFESENRLYSYCDIQKGVNLSTILLHRNPTDINVSDEVPVRVVRDVISTSIAEAPIHGKESVAMFANSTSIKTVLQNWSNKFAKIYKRKTLLHWYITEGMDQGEFVEADECVKDIISQYIEKESQFLSQ
eukprot:116184_1